MKKGKGKYLRINVTGMKEVFRPTLIRNDRGDWDCEKIENLLAHIAAAIPNDIEELFHSAIMRAGIHAGNKRSPAASRYIVESDHMEEVRGEMLHMRDKRYKRIPAPLSSPHDQASVPGNALGS